METTTLKEVEGAMPQREEFNFIRGLDAQGNGIKISGDKIPSRIEKSIDYKLGEWSKILNLKYHCSILLTLQFTQTNQSATQCFIINTGYGAAFINQIGYNNYTSHSDIPIRVTQTDDLLTYSVEIKGFFKDPLTQELRLRYSCLPLQSTGLIKGLETFVAGSGKPIAEIISNYRPQSVMTLEEPVANTELEAANARIADLEARLARLEAKQ